jgi:hypothetical protein
MYKHFFSRMSYIRTTVLPAANHFDSLKRFPKTVSPTHVTRLHTTLLVAKTCSYKQFTSTLFNSYMLLSMTRSNHHINIHHFVHILSLK